MEAFKIITNTTADLPMDYIKENQLGLIYFNYIMDGISYGKDKELYWKEFYRLMREEGKMPTTSQVNPQQYREYFEAFLEENKNLLYISFSSGLSGSCGNAMLAAEELMEEREDCHIIVVDSKCASMGEGLFVHKAVRMKEQGKTMKETADYLNELVPHLTHIFTVDDLNHLYRGGRVSKAAAIVGTIAGIKPVLHVDDEGHLIPLSKVRGRKKSLNALVDYMEEKVKDGYLEKNDIVFISHGDALADAEYVKAEIEKRFGITEFQINHIGPTIGAHSGPGTIALFFEGINR
ncbi:MAG: DegV family protein [Lachnospiraceae bacterium]|nr:DegV family protein [Lachnospiraceae bacterium]